MELKSSLFNLCESFVTEKLQTITDTIKSNKEALTSETKSSAGDKHETGRAMLQLEMEKAGQQLSVVNGLQEQLSKIDVNKVNKKGCLGSLITTNKFKYFIAISIGKVTIDQENYFVISPNSPIGKLLLGKEKGDSVTFNKDQITIEKVV